MPGDSSAQPAPGPGVDAQGRPVIDPTENVKALAAAGERRADDLRDAERRLTEAKLTHLAEIVELRAEYDELLRKKESERIDAIRAVDVSQVQRTAEDAATRANTLAAQVATAADVVRTTLATALEPIQKDIADLRRAQYEAQGQKTQVVEARGANQYVMGIVIFIVTLILVGAPLLIVVANKP
jgi:cobalamin biosynthesis Mg chelatase CobN